jgi:sigma-B regulation protein RsbU (phosphoserine phosphatase)
MTHPARLLLRSVVAAAVVYVVASAVEFAFIRAVAPTELELTWISDAVLAAAFGLAMFLWLHLRAARADIAHLERDQIVLDTQLSVAADIQRKFLPILPDRLDGIGWAAQLRSANKIGGDFYDFVQVNPDVALLIVGDIAGRGIPAALLLASTCTMFRMLVRDTQEPAILLERLSGALYADHGGQPYVTCIICSFNVLNQSLTYANAGHPAALIFGRAGRRTLSVGGFPAGMFPTSAYQSEAIILHEGDIGVILTDGISELIEQDGAEAADVIQSSIAKIPLPITPGFVCDHVMGFAMDLAMSGAQDIEPDDRTVVAFVVHSPA